MAALAQVSANPANAQMLSGIGPALIELRRFDEAIVAGKKTFVRIPPFWQLTAASRPPSPGTDFGPPAARRSASLHK
jgi:hypothetical protein